MKSHHTLPIPITSFRYIFRTLPKWASPNLFKIPTLQHFSKLAVNLSFPYLSFASQLNTLTLLQPLPYANYQWPPHWRRLLLLYTSNRFFSLFVKLRPCYLLCLFWILSCTCIVKYYNGCDDRKVRVWWVLLLCSAHHLINISGALSGAGLTRSLMILRENSQRVKIFILLLTLVWLVSSSVIGFQWDTWKTN